MMLESNSASYIQQITIEAALALKDDVLSLQIRQVIKPLGGDELVVSARAAMLQ